MSSKARVIAFYLPQYHPFKENDEWWGKGFTEWTNVGRAKPMFHGHYQPKVPADLGYYDLRMPIIRQQQAEMAREAGIEGFMYWHYWFGNGKRLMETVFDEVLETGKPDFPFCLAWANHSWYAKNWNTKDTKGKDKLLIEQKYFGEADYRQHYEFAVRAFKDPRYIKVDNKPIFHIFRPGELPDEFIKLWNKWAIEDGFDGIYFTCRADTDKSGNCDKTLWIDKGYSAVEPERLFDIRKRGIFLYSLDKIKRYVKEVLNMPTMHYKYEKIYPYLTDLEYDKQEDVIPTIIPNFDHSPRSGRAGLIISDSTPEIFKKHLLKIKEIIDSKNNKLVYLRSWNEWGEGNYMEPDIKYHTGYIDALRDVLL